MMLEHYLFNFGISCHQQVAQYDGALVDTFLSGGLIFRHLLLHHKPTIQIIQNSFILNELIASRHATEHYDS